MVEAVGQAAVMTWCGCSRGGEDGEARMWPRVLGRVVKALCFFFGSGTKFTLRRPAAARRSLSGAYVSLCRKGVRPDREARAWRVRTLSAARRTPAGANAFSA